MTEKRAKVVAHSNIALAKYWGKASVAENLPAVPSLSMTLDGMRTTTEVVFDAALAKDQAELGGVVLAGRPLERVVALLDRVRALSSCRLRARVVSSNDFPTASGLASSASGFAALALGATRALGLTLSSEEVSALARASSASAARSLFGGFVALGANAHQAEQVAPAAHWPLVMLVAVTTQSPKATGSTEGMQHTSRTSPYYPAWVEHAPRIYAEVRRAVLAKELGPLGLAMEHSALLMHASMIAAAPAVIYWSPITLAVMAQVRELRAAGTEAYFTMDAGPHVKVLTTQENALRVEQSLGVVPGVERVIWCGVGPDAHLVEAK